MANPRPKASFKKGDPRASAAGKKSSRRLPPDVKAARQFNAAEIERVIYDNMDASLEELRKKSKDPNTPARELVILSILSKAITSGDYSRLDFLLNRTIGKVVERVQQETRDLTKEEEARALAQHLIEIAKKPE